MQFRLNIVLGLYKKLGYHFLLQTSTDELISAPNIITFLPNPPFGNKNIAHPSNEIPYLDVEYLS